MSPASSLGSSLFLVPPATSPLRGALQSLISRDVPALFPDASPPDFVPHVTLTSQIAPAVYGDDPAGWLARLQVPAAALDVRFRGVEAEAPFFRKCNVSVARGEGLLALAGECRRVGVEGGDEAAARRWLDTEYRPHCSLL
ncbi:MAG: hypothetical protein INR71_07395 [Terriglobus roseus]|nr:hypothetical protein [Terriglobus roseus]